jgi:D-arginine dehydrogenase
LATPAFDFIVIGAGIAGISLADALAPFGTVAVVEAEHQPGYHSSGRSAALYAPNYGSETFRALARASGAFLRSPPAGFADHPLVLPRGALNIARAEQRTRLEQSAAEIESRGGRIEILSLQAARARVPLLRAEYVAAASYEEDVLDIDVHSLLQGFLRRARTHGTQLLLGAPLRAADRRHGVWEVQLADRSIQGRVLLNAAGAWSDEVAGNCGVAPLGLRPLRRTAALTEAPPGVNVGGWPALFDIDEQFYLKPDAGRLLISPAEEEPTLPCDAHAQDLDVAIAVDRIQSALDLDVRRVAHSWAGLRTFAPDRDPVVGFDVEAENFFWCGGQGGYGIQTSVALSALAGALARQASVPAALAAEGLSAQVVSPSRLRPGTR